MATKRLIYRRPQLAEYQLDALFHAERYGLIEASTKSGKTVGALCWLSEQAFLSKLRNRNFYWVAPVYQQAKVAYRRLRRWIPEALRTPNESELTLTLPNTNIISFRSGENADNLFSDDVDAAVIDEASRLREESFHAVRSTLTATRGPLRIIGNVKGRRNWFYSLARRAEAGETGMVYRRITAQDAVRAGILSAEEIDDARRILPEQAFKELFDAVPSDDGGNPFGLAHIAACVEPISTGTPVVFGVDLAKHVDFTVIVGLDFAGRVCRFERFQKPWTETMEEIRRIVGRVPALVDSTGVGDPVLEQIQRGDGIRPNFEGFNFSAASKQRIIEGLAVGIQQRAVRFPDGPLRIELDSFEYEYRRAMVAYSAPEGLHDDCVYALALAWSRWSGNVNKRPVSRWPSAEAASTPRPSWLR